MKEIREQGTGIALVRKPVRCVEAGQDVREATTGRVVSFVPRVVERPKVVLLPRVWAVATEVGVVPPAHDDGTVVNGAPGVAVVFPTHDDGTVVNGAPGVEVVFPTHDDGTVVNGAPGVEVVFPTHDDEAVVSGPPDEVGVVRGAPEVGVVRGAPGGGVVFPTHDDEAVVSGPPDEVGVVRGAPGVAVVRGVPGELAFYRKYTEAMLRRYVRLSMAAGRVPSLLGRELFRGNVTSYKMTNFEDVVVFCFDMEKLLGKMRTMDQQLIKRIAMQQYPQGEVASMLRISLRTCLQTYGEAIDRLTAMLLAARMLEPLNQ